MSYQLSLVALAQIQDQARLNVAFARQLARAAWSIVAEVP
jgi:hypothetical protein